MLAAEIHPLLATQQRLYKLGNNLAEPVSGVRCGRQNLVALNHSDFDNFNDMHKLRRNGYR